MSITMITEDDHGMPRPNGDMVMSVVQIMVSLRLQYNLMNVAKIAEDAHGITETE